MCWWGFIYSLFRYITVIGNEISVQTSRFTNARSQIEHVSNFHPLEVVGRGSETQLQVGENLNAIIERLKS